MTRTELFDILLKNRVESKVSGGTVDLRTYSEQKLNISDDALIESIVDEMISKGWVKPSNYSKFAVSATHEGKQMIEKYGSYSSFLRSLNKSESKDQRKKSTDRLINNISKLAAICFGVISIVLAINKFFISDVIIEKQEIEIKRLTKTIDSLKTILNKPIELDDTQ